MCHHRFVYQIAGDMPVVMQLLCRLKKKNLNCMNNNNNVLKICTLLAIIVSRSPACKNINLLIYKNNIHVQRETITTFGSYCIIIKHLMTQHIV